MQKNQNEIIEFINSLEGYEGYVQFSHRPIDKEKDLFLEGKKVHVENEKGFIYEAHFCNKTESLCVKQVNDKWFVSKTDISNIKEQDMQTFISDIKEFDYKIKMAQIWEEKPDSLCENMPVKKLQKVVFAGFKGAKS